MKITDMMNEKNAIIITHSPEETFAFGKETGRHAKPGEIYTLDGDLGAGKTHLTRYIAEGLGIRSGLVSPTFTIVCEYDEGRLPLYHFDVYRVHGEDELFELGFDEYIHGKGVCVIEWADLVRDLLPAETLWIELAYGSEEDERIAKISADTCH